MTTATTYGAREHARAQEGATAEAMPVLPASAWPTPPEGVAPESLVWAETVAGGGYAHKVLARGTHLRLTDLNGDACANLLLHNAFEPIERLNVNDTVKVQWNAYLGSGDLLLSDQARVLATIVADTSGAHDALCSASALAGNTAKYGAGEPHSDSPAGRELLKLALAKHGLGPRDVAPSLALLKGIQVSGDGGLEFTGGTGAGASVTLRVEMPVIVSIANTPHPLDPRPDYTASTLEVLAWRGTPTGPDDALRTRTPEGRRAFANTADYLAARGIA
ncbi:urea carboxylase-associated family protein [Saccharopolyspora sp. ID03-671]|uniref:urea amidolyase associated protein UAAP1 n=1 Tax=Saccharopolyspora sp. ID03-671 TaxID=3073066 RepID=UPI00324BF36D